MSQVCVCTNAYVCLIQYFSEGILIRTKDEREVVRVRERERTKVKHTGQRNELWSF